jgi:hypothetical protein
MKKFIPWIIGAGVVYLAWRAYKSGWIITTKAKQKDTLEAAIAEANKEWTDAAKKAAADKPVATEAGP